MANLIGVSMGVVVVLAGMRDPYWEVEHIGVADRTAFVSTSS